MSSLTRSDKSFSGLQIFMMIVVAIILSVVITSWVIFSDIFATEFEPVTLNANEEQVLSAKLNKLGVETTQSSSLSSSPLNPEAYSESTANRKVTFTEKEVNAMLARNTDLANKLAIDLANDLVSLKLLLPLDEELPLLGGKTLKVTAGIELLYRVDKPVVIIKGISIWGVPVPSAYMGDIKNLDIIEEFGESGFWKTFSDGLSDLHVQEGVIQITVKE